MRIERGFDFTQLNAEPTDLYLVVCAAKVTDITVRQVTPYISGLI
jgi:hypothetical protein